MRKEDIKLDMHPLLKPLEDSFMFFVVSQNMMAIPSFQETLVKVHNREMIQLQTSVELNGESALKFEVGYALNRFNAVTGMKEVNGSVEGNIGQSYVQQGILFSIAIFNILESSDYRSEMSRRSLFHFSRHLRNGAAHGNKFNFFPKEIEKLKRNTVCWRGKEIKHLLQGSRVLGDFIYLPDLFILMHDISKELHSIDSENKKKMGQVHF